MLGQPRVFAGYIHFSSVNMRFLNQYTGTMVAHRLRRWPSIEPDHGQRLC